MSRRGGRRGSKDPIADDDDEPFLAEDSAPAAAPAAEARAAAAEAEAEAAAAEQPSQPSGAGARSRRRGSKDPPEDPDYAPAATASHPADDSGLRGAASSSEPLALADAPHPGGRQSVESCASDDDWDFKVATAGSQPLEDFSGRKRMSTRSDSKSKDSNSSRGSRTSSEYNQGRKVAIADGNSEDNEDNNLVLEDDEEARKRRDSSLEVAEWGQAEEEDDDDGEDYMSDDGDALKNAVSMFAWQQDETSQHPSDDEDEDPDAMRMPHKHGHDASDDLQTKEVHINATATLAFMLFAVLWVFSAAALMLALTYHYMWVEVTSQADLAARAAVSHGSLHASEVLGTATTVMKTLDLGFRGGAISDIGDYVGFRKVLEPFYQALPELRDVEMADTPEYFRYVSTGSVLATRIGRTDAFETRSDRGDCALVPGRRGCVLEPQRANGSNWFQERRLFYPHPWSALPMFTAWSGPSFARDMPNEAVCDELCWSPTYSLASRISGGTDPFFVPNNKSYDPFNSIIVRVTMDATILIDVLKQIQMRSRGEAFICTVDGTIVAAVEMADVQKASEDTGDVEMIKAWEYDKVWAPFIDEQMVFQGNGQSMSTNDGLYLVSAWMLNSPHNATKNIGDSLRIVVAIPSEAYADSVLQSLRYWFIAVSSIPVAFILIAAMFNIYVRCCIRGNKELRHMSMEELQAFTRSKKEALRNMLEAEKRAKQDNPSLEKQGSRGTMAMTFSKTMTFLHLGRSSSRISSSASSSRNSLEDGEAGEVMEATSTMKTRLGGFMQALSVKKRTSKETLSVEDRKDLKEKNKPRTKIGALAKKLRYNKGLEDHDEMQARNDAGVARREQGMTGSGDVQMYVAPAFASG